MRSLRLNVFTIIILINNMCQGYYDLYTLFYNTAGDPLKCSINICADRYSSTSLLEWETVPTSYMWKAYEIQVILRKCSIAEFRWDIEKDLRS